MTTTGTFSRISSGQLVVEARDQRFVQRALHPLARIGHISITGVQSRDGVLRGVVLGQPTPGDELVVQYLPEPEIRTGIHYNGPPPLVS